MDRSRDILSTDTEEDGPQPPPLKKPRKVRKPRRPNNSERLDRLEQMIEKLISQRETSTQSLPGASTSAALATSSHEELQSSNNIAGGTVIHNTHILPSASLADNCADSYAPRLILNTSNDTASSAVPSSSIPNTINVVATPITTVVSQKDQSYLDCRNTVRFISKPENIPKFDGSTNTMSLHTWLHRLESLAKIYGWDEKTTIYHMTANLEGNALLWFGHQQNIDITWTDWKKLLTEYFPVNRGLAAKLHNLVTTNKQRDKQVIDFYYKKLALGKLCELSDHMICDVIIFTMGDPLLKAGARGAGCRDTRSLLNYLTDAVVEPLQYKNNITFFDKDMRPKCFLCGRRGHISSQCRDKIRCNYCNKIGHQIENCRLKPCDHCGKLGHEKKDCYSFKNLSVPNNSNTKPNSKLNDNNSKLFLISPIDINEQKFHKIVVANGFKLTAYIDLGSACNTIILSAAQKINLKYNNGCKTSIKGYGGQIIAPEGESFIDLSIDGVSANTSVLVVCDNLQDTDMIIGRAFSELPGICVTKTSDTLTFSKSNNSTLNIELPFSNHNEVCLSKIDLRVPHDIEIINGLNRILVYTERDVHTNSVKVQRSEHRSLGKEIDIPEQITELHGNLAYVDINNLQYQPITLFATRCVARGSEYESENIQINTDLLGSDLNCLENLLKKYCHCFDDHAGVGDFDIEMKIELTTEVSFYHRPYRMSLKEQDITRGIIQDLIEKDIIEPSNSPYASPIILVPKKTGEYRMCVDYRQLNKVTKKDRYPLPIIQDQLDRLSNEQFFTKLDLAAGFHQIKLHPDSRKYTAFVTPFGQYQYKRMPFGLANAPAVFQRAMNFMLNKHRFEFATSFFDDILLFSKTIPHALEHLELILDLISKSGLVLRREKCSFLKTSIDYLGHVISCGEIRPSPNKVKALNEFIEPNNIHDLRRFIGLASYFRKFIKSFANRIRPLSTLLRKDKLWNWGEEEQKSFVDIKEALISEPVLAIYNPELETQLHTDASNHGVGGILFQKQLKGDLKPIAYFSKQTTSMEQKYHSYELEAMAVVFSIRKFRVYLLGRHFKIFTDCQALSSTWTKKDMLPRIGRWWLELQSYDFEVQYRPGLQMQHVDALSRNALPLQHITEENWVIAVQNDDPKLQAIIKNIKNPEYKDLYLLKENILHKKIGKDYKIVIPKSVRWRITKMFHDDNGHMGETKVIELVQRQYWFEKLRRFVTKYVKACISCQFAKKPPGKQRGFLNPIAKGNIPWHTWHLDHLGPFCISKNKNCYLLVVIDAFSKYVWLQPVPNTCAAHVITTMNFLTRVFGLPTRIITDRGKAFTSQEFTNYCTSKQIRHILNAVSCPRANGQVERSNRTILQSLTAYTGENDEDWEQYLPQVEKGINYCINSSTQKCPFELLYGYKPRFDLDIYNVRQTTQLAELRSQAQNNNINASIKSKKRYDKNRLNYTKFNVGDLVQIQRRIIKKGLTSGKLVDKYAGPYKVIKVYDNDRYRVISLNKRGRKYNNIIAADKMKKFLVQYISSDDTDDEN